MAEWPCVVASVLHRVWQDILSIHQRWCGWISASGEGSVCTWSHSMPVIRWTAHRECVVVLLLWGDLGLLGVLVLCMVRRASSVSLLAYIGLVVVSGVMLFVSVLWSIVLSLVAHSI